jgi:hypothetical protein
MTRLGFHAPLTRLYVFIKNEGNALWYYLDDGTKHYIQENALTGTIKRFEVKESQTSFGSELKADFEIVADRRYVLRSGTDTAFTKGMLMTLASLSDEQLNRPITLELKAGDEKGNVLVSARDPETFEPIRTGSWENADWNQLMNQALARLGGEVTPHTSPQPQQTSPQAAPQPQPHSTPTQPYSLYPEHNNIIKAIRLKTGHSPDQIIAWCRQYNASTPAELTPELCRQLVEALALGWGESKFQTPELCKTSYDGKVQTLTAAGQHWGNAIASWIDSVAQVPVAPH